MSIHLKIKIKSLAEEARIIRHEEQKQLGSARFLRRRDEQNRLNERSEEQSCTYHQHSGLHFHRVVRVRQEARAALLAYAFLRGRMLDQVEGSMKNAPDWSKVLRMVQRYCIDVAGMRSLSLGTDDARLAVGHWIRASHIRAELRPECGR